MKTSLTREWQPRSLSGGQKAGECTQHSKRKSVWVRQGDAWIDTGLCATDMAFVERADRAIAKKGGA